MLDTFKDFSNIITILYYLFMFILVKASIIYFINYKSPINIYPNIEDYHLNPDFLYLNRDPLNDLY